MIKKKEKKQLTIPAQSEPSVNTHSCFLLLILAMSGPPDSVIVAYQLLFAKCPLLHVMGMSRHH